MPRLLQPECIAVRGRNAADAGEGGEHGGDFGASATALPEAGCDGGGLERGGRV
ncbi:hypothetical protein [Lichenifustis flavocetrariae]|uniref:Uncharacterized protein n=1 Tax=Lichenifustis flavocetrariae TaxID=2949735 RepID=A0AA41YZD2_9HYPH|nr:hypothetical protein [Lichenifustis flavocetrariae]MCW6507673.1 hypothetical protein [Lichenifustis flavocetrariae]